MPARPRSPAEIAESALTAARSLRRYHEGVLALAERSAPVRFIIDGAAPGVELVLPVETGFAAAEDLLLIAPDEPTWVWQASLTPTPIARPEIEDAVDRWAAYHGKCPPRSVWIRATLTGLKAQGLLGEHPVWREGEVSTTNLVRPAEGRALKRLNADRPLLARACKNHGPADVTDPLAVGVDPFGIDVRVRFGILRLEFPEHVVIKDPEQLERAVEFTLGTRPWSQTADAPAPPSTPPSPPAQP